MANKRINETANRIAEKITESYTDGYGRDVRARVQERKDECRVWLNHKSGKHGYLVVYETQTDGLAIENQCTTQIRDIENFCDAEFGTDFASQEGHFLVAEIKEA